jgi:hypothetical protein
VAAHLRRTLDVDVTTVEGRYGEFSVLVDGKEVFNAGALAFLGVLPSKRRVRELVLQHLRTGKGVKT